MRQFIIKAALVGGLLVPSLAFASGSRSAQDVMRGQLMRLHAQLTREAMNSSEIDDARKAAGLAYSTLYQVRENILLEVRNQEAYVDLKLALWHMQRQLEGLHTELPVRVSKILSTATDTLSIRTQMSRMEMEALEASDDYLNARDDANAKVAAYRRTVNDALESVRNDPQLMAMSEQLRAMSTLRTARRSTQY